MGTLGNVLVGNATVSIKYPIGGTYTEVGYTVDGVQLEANAETTDIMVEEETFAIERPISKEELTVTLNMAEGSLFNIDKAIAGSILAGSTITVGGGSQKEMSIKIVGTSPSGTARTIEIPLATATGSVATPYKKDEIQVYPATFKALKGASDPYTIVDS